MSGKHFDARRAYSEFVLKQRIDAAAELLKASLHHFQLLAEASLSRRTIKAGNLGPDGLVKAKKTLEEALDSLNESMARMNEAGAAAYPFFSSAFRWAVSDLFVLEQKAQFTGGEDMDLGEVQAAFNHVVEVVHSELDVALVLEYQRKLFKRSSWLPWRRAKAAPLKIGTREEAEVAKKRSDPLGVGKR